MKRLCCCGLLKITTAAQIVAILFGLVSLGTLVTVSIPSTLSPLWFRICTSLFSCFDLLAALLVFIACRSQNSSLLIPILLALAIFLIEVTISFVFCIGGLFDRNSALSNWIRNILNSFERRANTTPVSGHINNVFLYTALLTLITFIALSLTIWFIIINKKCFDYLREIQESRQKIDNLMKKNLERMNDLCEIIIEDNAFTPAGSIARHTLTKRKRARKGSAMRKECCCGTCSVTTGAQIIATVIIIFAVGSGVSAVAMPERRSDTGAKLVANVIQIAASILVFVACKKICPQMMIPMLVLYIIGNVLLVIAFIAVLVKSIRGKEAFVGVLITLVIAIIVHIWFFTVFRKCYKYLKELARTSDNYIYA